MKMKKQEHMKIKKEKKTQCLRGSTIALMLWRDISIYKF